MRQFYYKTRQLLQNAIIMLKNATFNTNCVGARRCYIPEVDLGSCQFSMIELFVKKVNCSKSLFAFGESAIRSSHPEVFLRKGVQKIRSKFTGEHPCRSVNSIKLLCNIIEIALRHGCSPVNLLHIFRNLFLELPLGGCFCTIIDI